MEREKVGPSKEGPGACKYPFNSSANDQAWTWKPCWMILNRGSLFIYVHIVQSGKAAGANSGKGSYSQRVEVSRGQSISVISQIIYTSGKEIILCRVVSFS